MYTYFAPYVNIHRKLYRFQQFYHSHYEVKKNSKIIHINSHTTVCIRIPRLGTIRQKEKTMDICFHSANVKYTSAGNKYQCNKKLIKKMAGIFWQEHLTSRPWSCSISLNKSTEYLRNRQTSIPVTDYYIDPMVPNHRSSLTFCQWS